MKSFKKAALRLARADMVFWLMPPLMALLIAGTVAQRWIGLHEAHQTYFSSFFFWAGPVPLPGGYTLLGLLSLNLTLKFLFSSKWTWRKAGINLTHIGALVLLIGGLLTALTAVERYMIIAEGQESPYMYDYIQRELTITGGNNLKIKLPLEHLKENSEFSSVLPFRIKTLSTCTNCEIRKRTDVPNEFNHILLHGMAKFMSIRSKTAAKNPEENISGIVFELSDVNDNQAGIYLAIEGMPKPIEIKHKDLIYYIMLGKAQSRLPFSIVLKDFTKDTYPGTGKARAFSSDIIVKDGESEWPALIEMNKPLRYKGYTFFQSSFEQTQDTTLSIFSVVENKGRLLPYIGTLLLAAGLLLHIFIVLRIQDKKGENA